jgi:hypothetical protein
VGKIKNVPPEKETIRIIYKNLKRTRKKKGRRNLKDFKILTMYEAKISTFPSQIVGWIRS